MYFVAFKRTGKNMQLLKKAKQTSIYGRHERINFGTKRCI